MRQQHRPHRLRRRVRVGDLRPSVAERQAAISGNDTACGPVRRVTLAFVARLRERGDRDLGNVAHVDRAGFRASLADVKKACFFWIISRKPSNACMKRLGRRNV